MNNIIEDIFQGKVNRTAKSDAVINAEKETEFYRKRLNNNLNQKQKMLLLKFEDGKDLVKHRYCTEAFAEGFKLGLKIGYESNK